MVKFSRLPLVFFAVADNSANSVGADVKPSTTRFHQYEVLLVGMAVAAIALSAQDYLTRLPSNNALSFYWPVVGISALLLIETLLISLISYFWGSRRILPPLREKYARISILFFVGSAIGSAVTSVVVLFVSGISTGETIDFPIFIPSSIIQMVGFSFMTTFVALGAFLVAYFRHKETIG